MEDFKEYANKTGSPEKGDLLFASGGEIGLALYKGDDFPVYVQGGSILYVRTSKSEHLKGLFLKYSFESPKIKSYIKSASTGTSLKHFVLKPANSLPVSYPAMKEQEQIGAFFKSIDDTIALHQEKLEKLKQLKKAYLQMMFPQNGEKVPRLRFANFSSDWENREFISIVNRKSTSSSSNKLPKVEFEDIVAGEGRLNKDISHKFDDRRGIIFEPGNILYGKLRPYLKNWLLPDFEGIALGDFWVFETVNSDEKFDYYLIQADKYQKVANDTTGTKMPRSDWKKVSVTSFSIPSFEEQNRIGAFFKKIDDSIALHRNNLEDLKSLKKVYLKKLFV